MDPYRKVQPGERLKVPARAWNELMGGLGVRPGFEVGQGQPGRVDYITVHANSAEMASITNLWPDHIAATPQGHKLQVGFGMSVDVGGSVLRSQSAMKTNASELAAFSTENLFATNNFEFPYNAGKFGIITSVSVVPANEQTETPEKLSITMAIGGVFVCRCLAFALGDSLVGPVSVPTTNAVKPLWYPYPVTSPVGLVNVLAYGNYVKLTENAWPRIYEVLVKM